jgi:hypothetical protein
LTIPTHWKTFHCNRSRHSRAIAKCRSLVGCDFARKKTIRRAVFGLKKFVLTRPTHWKKFHCNRAQAFSSYRHRKVSSSSGLWFKKKKTIRRVLFGLKKFILTRPTHRKRFHHNQSRHSRVIGIAKHFCCNFEPKCKSLCK